MCLFCWPTESGGYRGYFIHTPSNSQPITACPPFATSLAWICSFFRASWPCLGCSGCPLGLSVPRLLGIESSWSEALETVVQRNQSCQGGNAECQAGWLTCFLGHRNSWYISVTQDCWLHVQELFWLTFGLFYNVTQVALYPLLWRAGKEVREVSCT